MARKRKPKQWCIRCGCTHSLHLHHIVPQSEGGDNAPGNLAWLCSTCHREWHETEDFVGLSAQEYGARFGAWLSTMPAWATRCITEPAFGDVTLAEAAAVWRGMREFLVGCHSLT